MLVTLVLPCFVLIEITYGLPPTIPVNRNAGFNLQQRYNERFLQKQNIPQVNRDIRVPYNGLQNLGVPINHQTNVPQNIAATQNRNIYNIPNALNENERRIIQQAKPQLNRNIGVVPPNRNLQQIYPPQKLNQQGHVYSQNFQINLRGYVASPLSDGRVQSDPIVPQFPGTMQQSPRAQNLPLLGIFDRNSIVTQTNMEQPISNLIVTHGTVEESDTLDAVKRDYPYYILRRPNKPRVPQISVQDAPITNTDDSILIMRSGSPLETVGNETKPYLETNDITSPIPQSNETSAISSSANNLENISDEDDNNDGTEDILENLNADDFWNPLSNINQISDPENDSLSYIGKNISNVDKPDLISEGEPGDSLSITVNGNDTTEEQIPTSEETVDIDDKSKLQENTTEVNENIDDLVDQEMVDDFINSIEDMVEFIAPFVDLSNQTESAETFEDDSSESTTNISNEAYNVNDSSIDADNNEAMAPIYIPNINQVQNNDTPFWFNTSDENAWRILTQKNDSNVFVISPQVRVEREKVITIHPNGTMVEEITETTRRDDGRFDVVKRTKTIHPDGFEEIKNR
ncbi:unnamed protein product [Leptosia nina]|uniref:Uncharacterized protein n=1 Tax=Leptosia nina TaxID=320188 RepID=A0AAV1JV18_9NEOP